MNHSEAPLAQGPILLDAVIDAWDRSNTILTNLLRSLPKNGLETRAAAGSPTVAEMFTHMHHERMISVLEEAPEFAGTVPEKEWIPEPDPIRIEQLLTESHKRVRDAVKHRVQTGRQLDRSYDHPVLLLQLLMFHESYHHGQIKLALKLASCPVPDRIAGPLTWDIWRRRTGALPLSE